MPVLTSLTQFEQDDLENEICDATGIDRQIARTIVAHVFVPRLEKTAQDAHRRALEFVVAGGSP